MRRLVLTAKLSSQLVRNSLSLSLPLSLFLCVCLRERMQLD